MLSDDVVSSIEATVYRLTETKEKAVWGEVECSYVLIDHRHAHTAQYQAPAGEKAILVPQRG